MRCSIIIVLIALVLTAPGAAQKIPQENPDSVRVKGRLLSHSWRDGRIWVSTRALAPLLNIKRDSLSLDLIEELDKKGGYEYSIVDGAFSAKKTRKAYSPEAPTARKNSPLTAYYHREFTPAAGDRTYIKVSVTEARRDESGNLYASVKAENRSKFYRSAECELLFFFLDNERNVIAMQSEFLKSLSKKDTYEFDVWAEPRETFDTPLQDFDASNVEFKYLRRKEIKEQRRPEGLERKTIERKSVNF